LKEQGTNQRAKVVTTFRISRMSQEASKSYAKIKKQGTKPIGCLESTKTSGTKPISREQSRIQTNSEAGDQRAIGRRQRSKSTNKAGMSFGISRCNSRPHESRIEAAFLCRALGAAEAQELPTKPECHLESRDTNSSTHKSRIEAAFSNRGNSETPAAD
jgi:hypothetical protein